MFGIILGLALLIVLAYFGMSIIWVAPVCAMVVAATGGLELLPTYTGTYMIGLVGFVQSYFPMFMLGAIFGKIMDDSKAAKSVAVGVSKVLGADKALLATVLACAILTYGGISLFVVVFAVLPLATSLFREANITRKMLPGAVALGAFAFTMTAVPGTPQIQNVIPTNYFGTTGMAAPIMGIVATVIMFGGGMVWLTYSAKKRAAAGEVFIEPDASILQQEDTGKLPNAWLSALPLVVVIVVYNVLPAFFNLPEGIANNMIVVALLCGIVLSIVLALVQKTLTLPELKQTINAGAQSSVMAILNTSAAVGFGSVVRAVPGFADLTNMMMGIGGNPLISEAIAVNVMAGATGSASGGMGIALEALSENFIAASASSGIPIEAFHRIASISSGGLDTLPHNGAVLTVLAATGMTHKDSYIDIFVTCCAIPVLAVIVCIIMGSIGII